LIANVSSSSTYKPLPLLSVYRASKAAVTSLTESADLELAQFNIRARVVVPGMAPSTNFAASAQEQIAKGGWFPPAYQDFADQTMAALHAAGSGEVTTARDVAEAVIVLRPILTVRWYSRPELTQLLGQGASSAAHVGFRKRFGRSESRHDFFARELHVCRSRTDNHFVYINTFRLFQSIADGTSYGVGG